MTLLSHRSSRGAWADLWLFDLAAHGAQLLELGRNRRLLDADAIERSSKFASSAQAQSFLASRTALRLVLDQYDDGRRDFDFGPHGKPSLGQDISFSLSRTQAAAIVAVANAAIGADIERRRPVDLTEPLLGEIGALLPHIGWPAAADRPLHCWTILEAWVKYHGLSLARLLDDPSLAARLRTELGTHIVELTPLLLPAHLCGTVCTGPGTVLHYQESAALIE